MTSEQYSKRIGECKALLTSLRKDIEYREGQFLREEPTYNIDAEIRGSFIQLDQLLQRTQRTLNNVEKAADDFHITPKQIQNKRLQFTQALNQKNALKIKYDQAFAKKSANKEIAKAADNMEKFQNQHDTKQLTKKDLIKMKEEQEKVQDDAIDDLIVTVKQIKTGQQEIGQELEHQEVLLDKLEGGIDKNSTEMSKTRRNMAKLLESSGYTCLILVILIEIAGILCNLLLWK